MSFDYGNGGQAFPRCDSMAVDGVRRSWSQDGMTRRQWYAGKALTAMTGTFYSEFFVKAEPKEDTITKMAKSMVVLAFYIADEMIAFEVTP